VIVTDDNPRSEDPASIRREIMPGAPGAREIGNRAEAIGQAVAALEEADALIIAGKGHEDYQIIGGDVHHFSDRAEAVKAARAAGAPLLMVGDTQKALEDLGRASRARSHAKIVAITGSAGKTTTKEMLRLMLSTAGQVAASAASYNNHWGVPLSLARMTREAAF